MLAADPHRSATRRNERSQLCVAVAADQSGAHLSARPNDLYGVAAPVYGRFRRPEPTTAGRCL